MVEIIHYLKDGTVLQDITGHVVREEDAQILYNLMDRINEKWKSHGDNSQ